MKGSQNDCPSLRSYYFYLDVLVLLILIFNLLDNGIHACGDEEDRFRLFDDQDEFKTRNLEKIIIILVQALM